MNAKCVCVVNVVSDWSAVHDCKAQSWAEWQWWGCCCHQEWILSPWGTWEWTVYREKDLSLKASLWHVYFVTNHFYLLGFYVNNVHLVIVVCSKPEFWGYMNFAARDFLMQSQWLLEDDCDFSLFDFGYYCLAILVILLTYSCLLTRLMTNCTA